MRKDVVSEVETDFLECLSLRLAYCHGRSSSVSGGGIDGDGKYFLSGLLSLEANSKFWVF